MFAVCFQLAQAALSEHEYERLVSRKCGLFIGELNDYQLLWSSPMVETMVAPNLEAISRIVRTLILALRH